MAVSNNLIAGLLVVAIVISGYSVLAIANFAGPITLTGGLTSQQGYANLTISGQVDIKILRGRNVTDFGSGTLGGAWRVIDTQADNYQFDDGSEGNGTVYGTCV